LKTSEGSIAKIAEPQRQPEALDQEYRRIPAKVPIREAFCKEEIRRLEFEKNILLDAIKIQGLSGVRARCRKALIPLR